MDIHIPLIELFRNYALTQLEIPEEYLPSAMSGLISLLILWVLIDEIRIEAYKMSRALKSNIYLRASARIFMHFACMSVITYILLLLNDKTEWMANIKTLAVVVLATHSSLAYFTNL